MYDHQKWFQAERNRSWGRNASSNQKSVVPLHLLIQMTTIMMNRDYLQAQGFEGFKTMGELMDGAKSRIPVQKGDYVVLREGESVPQFLQEGTGGFFKGRNPNVSLAELEENWVAGTPVLYIGKAGGAASSATLHKRLDQYLRFGQGANVGHWGDRYIWQLADSRDLVICWKVLINEEPREVERQMIADFKAVHAGKRPFANLMD